MTLVETDDGLGRSRLGSEAPLGKANGSPLAESCSPTSVSPRSTAAAFNTACTGLRYPVQRHNTPAIASRTWPSLGLGVLSSKALAARICAGVQYPHWIAPASTNACCKGCNPSVFRQPCSGCSPKPSIVTISCPPACAASIEPALTGLPSNKTVSAPERPCSSPNLIP